MSLQYLQPKDPYNTFTVVDYCCYFCDSYWYWPGVFILLIVSPLHPLALLPSLFFILHTYIHAAYDIGNQNYTHLFHTPLTPTPVIFAAGRVKWLSEDVLALRVLDS